VEALYLLILEILGIKLVLLHKECVIKIKNLFLIKIMVINNFEKKLIFIYLKLHLHKLIVNGYKMKLKGKFCVYK